MRPCVSAFVLALAARPAAHHWGLIHLGLSSAAYCHIRPLCFSVVFFCEIVVVFLATWLTRHSSRIGSLTCDVEQLELGAISAASEDSVGASDSSTMTYL